MLDKQLKLTTPAVRNTEKVRAAANWNVEEFSHEIIDNVIWSMEKRLIKFGDIGDYWYSMI